MKVRRLGRISYGDALELQEKIVAQKAENLDAPD